MGRFGLGGEEMEVYGQRECVERGGETMARGGREEKQPWGVWE